MRNLVHGGISDNMGEPKGNLFTHLSHENTGRNMSRLHV